MKINPYLLIVLTLFIPINTPAHITSESFFPNDNTRADEISQAAEKKLDMKKTDVPLLDGTYVASSQKTSMLFVKNDDTIKSIIYHHGEPRGICATGVINNSTRIVVWEIYSFFAWHYKNIISVKFNGDEKSFDLESMEVRTRSQFERYYEAAGIKTLWRDMWKEFMNCKYFFGMLYL